MSVLAPSAADKAMDRYAAGDDDAFLEVYDHLAPKLHRFLVRLTRNTATAEDLVQQTFLQMHDARGRFEPGAAVTPWSFAIARRLFLDSTRRAKFEGSVRDDGEDLAIPAGDAGDPEQLVEAMRMARAAHDALQRLPETQRTAYLLVREEGLSVAEAAEVLGTSVAAVKLRAFRAYEALRRVLGLNDDHGGDS